MKRTQAFLVSFTITFCIMIISFMAVYWVAGRQADKAAGKNQQGVPILSLTPEDTKTLLLVLDDSDAKFYFLLQLNGIQNKVNLVSVPASYYLSLPQRTLAQSMDYAGVRQCVQDLSEQFGIAVDYYLVADITQFTKLVEVFGEIDTSKIQIPQSVKTYLLKNVQYISPKALMDVVGVSPSLLDNGIGIEFLNTVGDFLLQHNLEKLEAVGDKIKENYTKISTDINTRDIQQLKRIVRLLKGSQVEFAHIVLQDEADAQQQINTLFKE